MKLKLVVLAGAKEGLEIPLKKEKFLIGRAKECALRAGSEAISRQHCAITRHADHYTVKDLGSRNGTYVNDERIAAEVPLVAGNELRVGPLKFHVEILTEKTAKPETAPPAALPKLAPANGSTKKQPPVKDMADVVQRTINKSDNKSEDDVSRWLLGISEPVDERQALKQTQSLKADETSASMNRVTMSESSTIEDVSKVLQAGEEDEADAVTNGEPGTEDVKLEEGSGVWKWLKRGKAGPTKKEPGKLPPRSDQGPTKDSRSAAADILREMQRRR
ncbi:MAG TPA: FHA domain-containing protein [Lacipirellulaceae bacterium]|jgi:pSer/pThr/pTyr-binding forkhead associated (FHA) protein|nr:FHA domain-containing protein [Lacipirellulaceae bacterium]